MFISNPQERPFTPQLKNVLTCDQSTPSPVDDEPPMSKWDKHDNVCVGKYAIRNTMGTIKNTTAWVQLGAG